MSKRGKKNVKDIQSALLSKTGFLNREEPTEEVESTSEPLIDQEILEKLEILAEYEKTETSELINKALHHFLRLKGLQLEKAMAAKK